MRGGEGGSSPSARVFAVCPRRSSAADEAGVEESRRGQGRGGFVGKAVEGTEREMEEREGFVT